MKCLSNFQDMSKIGFAADSKRASYALRRRHRKGDGSPEKGGVTVDKIVKELKDGGISVRGRPLLRVDTR
jgi:hypothetical protein